MYYTQGDPSQARRTFRAMEKKRLATIAAGWFASNLLWGLVAPGLGILVGGIVAGLVDVAQPWRSFMFVGVLLVVTGLVLGIVRPLVASRLPQPKSAAAGESGSGFTDWVQKAAVEGQQKEVAEQEASERVAIHEVITTLRHHRHEIAANLPPRADKDAGFQGEWPESRKLLARKSRYDRPLRIAEDAFQAIWIARLPSPSSSGRDEAVRTIDLAVKELYAALPGREEQN
jgi:hypothetical protein